VLWLSPAIDDFIAGIFVGSRGLRDFDPALVSYAGASVLAGFGLGYRYAMWLRRPPTRLYWYRGWKIFLEPRKLPRNLAHLVRVERGGFATVHRSPLAPAMVGSLVSGMGMHSGCGRYVSAFLRLGSFRERRQ
jgi:hypothetical protein